MNKTRNKKQDNAVLIFIAAAVLFLAFKPAKKRKGSLIIGEPYDGEYLPDNVAPTIVDTLQPKSDTQTDVLPVRVVTDSGGNITAYDAAGSVYTPIVQPFAGGGSVDQVYTGGGGQGDKMQYIGPFEITYDQAQNMISGRHSGKRGNLGSVKII